MWQHCLTVKGICYRSSQPEFKTRWTIDGRILQLSPWKESFQPTFEKLSTMTVWIQLYHVPIELQSGELLENIASQFGQVLKVDDHTLICSRSKFTRLCIEMGLDQPLQKGTWVQYGGNFFLFLFSMRNYLSFVTGMVVLVTEKPSARLWTVESELLSLNCPMPPPSMRWWQRIKLGKLARLVILVQWVSQTLTKACLKMVLCQSLDFG